MLGMNIKVKNMSEQDILAEFKQIFAEVTDYCLITLQNHVTKMRDSWKTCDKEVLEQKLCEEFIEWRQASRRNRVEDEQHELIDLINMVVMMWKRNQLDHSTETK